MVFTLVVTALTAAFAGPLWALLALPCAGIIAIDWERRRVLRYNAWAESLEVAESYLTPEERKAWRDGACGRGPLPALSMEEIARSRGWKGGLK